MFGIEYLKQSEQWPIDVCMFCSLSLLAVDNDASKERCVPSNIQDQMSGNCSLCVNV